MADLVKLLERFNRKERFYLIGQALGNREFCLDEDFRKKLSCELGIEIPPHAFAAMDYHLDAVAGALWQYRNPKRRMERPFPKRSEMIQGTQRDVDLLIAFKNEDLDEYQLVFVEAKGYGAGGFAKWEEYSDQIQEKAQQYSRIFGPDEDKTLKVAPRFCLASHSRPEALATDEWPDWMKKEPDGKPYWIKLDLPSERLRVTRCDENGNSFSRGECFRIIDESAANERSDLRYDRNNPDRTTKAGLKDRRYKANR